ncbi:hypothetical protein D0863_01157 [Hortaea werneckii]|uniref:Uncharacterized protein n=1 Tax=Hortaea werneckii TaxID=91943 RepID=A0A3M7EN87_HORWE|nr:hypothetical protein D0863_01157 [Hortaea werneckii]
MTEPTSKGPRGHYSRFRCLNFLGRPAAKRKRTDAPLDEEQDGETSLLDSSTDHVVFDPHLNEYLLCNVTDDGISSSSAVTPSPHNKHEALDTLVSPAHFVAAVLTHDTIFAARIGNGSDNGKEDLLDLVSSGLAALLDEQGDTNLLPALARRVAEKLHLSIAGKQLEGLLQRLPPLGVEECETQFMDALQWCQVLIDDQLTSGVVDKTLSAVQELIDRLEPILTIAREASRHLKLSGALVYQLFSAINLCSQIKNLLEAKKAWRSLEALSDVIEKNHLLMLQQRTDIQSALDAIKDNTNVQKGQIEEAMAAAAMLDGEIGFAEASISGSAMFYAIMARLKQTSEAEDGIEPQEAVQVSDQIIDALKELRIGKALDLHNFLARHGPPRDEAVLKLLSTFCHTAETVQLRGVPFLPPPRQFPFLTLFYCRVLVEDHAARIKGWGGLGPTVDPHLDAFQRCAQKIEAMSAAPAKRPVNDAFAHGCLYAASAKLIRLLHKRLSGWKEGFGKRETAVESNQAPKIHDLELDSTAWWQDGIENFNFDELFGQWAGDFSNLFPDDT